MIDRQEIADFSREFGLAPNVIEKDYMLGCGEARPEGEQLVAVAELRKIGKREARMRADELARKQR